MRMVTITCDGCGIKFRRRLAEHNRSVKLGRKEFHTQSCQISYNHEHGVYPDKSKNLTPGSNHKWKDEFSPFRKVLTSIRRRSKRKNWNVVITLKDLKDMWEKQKGICPYTGWKMNLVEITKGNYRNPLPKNASIDRIDNDKPYTPDNVVFCCYIANIAKGIFSKDDLIEFCKAVSRCHRRSAAPP